MQYLKGYNNKLPEYLTGTAFKTISLPLFYLRIVHDTATHFHALGLSLLAWFGLDARSSSKHDFNLISESPVHQTINKRVDGRVKHDHRVRNRIHRWTKALGAKVAHDVDNGICNPTDRKDNADDKDGQGGSLPYLLQSLFTREILKNWQNLNLLRSYSKYNHYFAKEALKVPIHPQRFIYISILCIIRINLKKIDWLNTSRDMLPQSSSFGHALWFGRAKLILVT